MYAFVGLKIAVSVDRALFLSRSAVGGRFLPLTVQIWDKTGRNVSTFCFHSVFFKPNDLDLIPC